jgi:YHS domain-containing protein
MNDVEALLGRIDAEFEAAKRHVEEFQHEKVAEYQQRQQRLETFGRVCDQLRDIWKPRLEALAKRFAERVDLAPSVTPSLRQARFRFHSQIASIVLTFSATTDDDVHNLVLHYHLEILPILMKFKKEDRLEMPLDNIDREAIGAWIDERILDFVKDYLALHQNEQYLSYLKNYTVQDPIAGVRFPKYAAATQCEWKGQTYYFIGEETLQQFRKSQGIEG